MQIGEIYTSDHKAEAIPKSTLTRKDQHISSSSPQRQTSNQPAQRDRWSRSETPPTAPAAVDGKRLRVMSHAEDTLEGHPGGHPESHELHSTSSNGARESIEDVMQDHRRHRPLPLSDRARRRSDASRSTQSSGRSVTSVPLRTAAPGTTPGMARAGSSAGQRSRRSSQGPSRRPRGFSRSSVRSDADTSSLGSRRSHRSQRSLGLGLRRSRSRGHVDDTDAESNDSYGHTDEDVCFPMDQLSAHEPDDGVNVSELDQLLNLSSDAESGHPSEQPSEHDRQHQNESRPEQSEEDSLVQRFQPQNNQAPPKPEQSSSPNPPDGEGSEETQVDMEAEEAADKIQMSTLPPQSPSTVLEGDRHYQLPYIAPENPVYNPVADNGSAVDMQRFSFFAAEMEDTIHASDLASLVEDGESFSSLFNKEKGVWWLDCYCPSDLEMKVLSRAFGIHPLTTEDIKTEESREKFEMFPKYYFVVYNSFVNDPEDEDYMEPINFYIVVFQDGVISFHFSPVSHCRSVRRRMRQLRDYVRVSPDWICYALIDDITDSFAPVIQNIEDEADYIEDAVYVQGGAGGASEIGPLLSRLGEARKSTMTMMRLLGGKADVVKGFAKRCNEGIHMPGTDMALYLGDIQDHIVTMQQNLASYEKIFSRSHYNYMGILQMEFVNSSNRMTTILSNVTVIGTILVPMNLVTGMFGMNVRIPGQQGPNLGWFFGILGVMLLVIVTMSTGAAFVLRRLQKNNGVVFGNNSNQTAQHPPQRNLRRIRTQRSTA